MLVCLDGFWLILLLLRRLDGGGCWTASGPWMMGAGWPVCLTSYGLRWVLRLVAQSSSSCCAAVHALDHMSRVHLVLSG